MNIDNEKNLECKATRGILNCAPDALTIFIKKIIIKINHTNFSKPQNSK